MPKNGTWWQDRNQRVADIYAGAAYRALLEGPGCRVFINLPGDVKTREVKFGNAEDVREDIFYWTQEAIVTVVVDLARGVLHGVAEGA